MNGLLGGSGSIGYLSSNSLGYPVDFISFPMSGAFL